MRANDLTRSSDASRVTFRRRESTLSAGSAAVNDRSSYEARSVFELDALSAIGAIVNAQDGVDHFLNDQPLRDIWLDTLERELLKRYLERILAFHPTIHETIQHLDTVHGRPGGCFEFIEPAASADSFIELIYYAVFGLLVTDPRAASLTRSDLASNRVEDLLADSKQRALLVLIEWIAEPVPARSLARSEFESLFLDHKDRQAVKQLIRRFRQATRRELQHLREFVAQFVSVIAENAIVSSLGIPISSAILPTHIPETFVRDNLRMPTRVKQPFLISLEKLRGSSPSAEGSLMEVIDPSLNCTVLDNKSRYTQQLPIVVSERDAEPEVFSAYGHGGQSSNARASTLSLRHDKRPGFQWMPSDVMIHSTGVASIESEINSVHPAAFPAIYSGMEHLLAGFVPLFEQVLTSIATRKPPPPSLQRVNAPIDRQTPPLSRHFQGFPSEEVEKVVMTKSKSTDTTKTVTKTKDKNAGTATSVSVDAGIRLQEHQNSDFLKHRLPLGPHFARISTPLDESHAFPLQKRHIQVIPKVSMIHLTPKHPKYCGQHSRAWQVDGDSDERLVAIGFHVLEHDNISMPEISFRAFAHTLSKSLEPASSHDEFLEHGEKIAGYHDGGYGRTFLQPWGSMALLPDRSFSVPAFLAHKLEPFELLDPSLGGRLTLVTLYLVDPTHTIASTTTLRPEQHDRRWVEASVDLLRDPLTPAAVRLSPALLGYVRGHREQCETREFPDEIAQLIGDFAASDKSSADAAGRRELLRKERARRHEIRFLHPMRTLEQLRITLPGDTTSSA